jgi:hypothetical protein
MKIQLNQELYFFDFSNILLKRVGITIKVKKVDINRPDIRVTAIGTKKELPEKAKGISPIIVVIVLSIIGRYLLSSDETHEYLMLFPSKIDELMYSRRRIALFTTIPIKLASPRPAVNEKGCLNKYSPAIEPIIDKGTVISMIRACLDDLNCIRRITYMAANAYKAASAIPPKYLFMVSFSPL